MFLVVVSIVAAGLAIFFGALSWRLVHQDRLRSASRVAALSDAIDEATMGESPVDTVSVQPEFLAHERPVVRTQSFFKLAVGFAMTVIVVIVFAMLGATRSSGTAAAAAAAIKSPSLELLSMRHVREADALTVTGLVRNGGSGSADRLIAVVFAFDRSGNFLASGRAPIDFLSLAPGDESPFKVSVPNAGEVGRYRVSFRTEAGVVKHVDRRQSLLARQGE
jgi:type IV secretory pathway VirB2 component (pilin)